MEDRECELLFEYLKHILYENDRKNLKLEQLSQSGRKLGEGLLYLEQAVREMQRYSADLSTGNLSGPCPGRDNFLCNNLKNLQANLNHLTWQAKQVAAGDYTQEVSYLGEFSEAFNTMTRQLKEREAFLKEQAQALEKRAELIESYNKLLMELTRKRSEWIVVVDADTAKILYCNKYPEERMEDLDSCQHNCRYCLPIRDELLAWKSEEQYRVWEREAKNGRIYRITTFPVEWRNRMAWAHFIQDITAKKQQERRLEDKAYHDALTGVFNRTYFTEKLERLLQKKKDFILIFIDLDGLKNVNDRMGHGEGDHYLCLLADTVREAVRSNDVFCRVGGDEFCLLLRKCTPKSAEQKMEAVLASFRERSRRYRGSFSYGMVTVRGAVNAKNGEELLEQADNAMYVYKRKNRYRQEGVPEVPKQSGD